jgi:uncharacterized protein with HEPN domain
MMNERDVVYLRHIRDAAHQIQGYVQGVNESEFRDDEMLQDALIRQLSIIGEAAGQLSEETRKDAPSIPWTDIYGMRNKLVHDYLGVDLDAVWDTVQEDLPPLLDSVQALIDEAEDA